MEPYRHILAAIDLSPYSLAVLRRGLILRDAYQARLTVLHVVEYVFPLDMDYVLPPIDRVEAELMEEGHKKVEALLKEAGMEGIPAEVVASPTPWEAIVEEGKRQGADLLVLASHGHRGIRALIGTTLDRVLHHACCDILVVRAKD
ncbi:MAG: universal stress protein [Gammaproteobacteria bacterium]|nr:MAG: universal stress protein [Gammaproteobacteria bacterium]